MSVYPWPAVVPGIQPQVGSRINPHHPLASGMFFCHHGNRKGVNLVTMGRLSATGTPEVEVGTDGLALTNPGGAGRYFFAPDVSPESTAFNWVSPQAFTLLCDITPTVTDLNNVTLRTIVGHGSGAGPSGFYVMTSRGGADSMIFEFASSSSGPRTAANLVGGTFYRCCMVHTVDNTNQWWVNGSKSGAAVTQSMSSANWEFRIGQFSTLTDWPFLGLIHRVVAWNRALSDGEAQMVTRSDPYAYMHRPFVWWDPDLPVEAGEGQPTMRRWGHVWHLPTSAPRLPGIR